VNLLCFPTVSPKRWGRDVSFKEELKIKFCMGQEIVTTPDCPEGKDIIKVMSGKQTNFSGKS